MVKYYIVISLILFYLFLKKGSNTMNCAICGKKLKVIAVNKVMVRDGDYICFDCCKDAGHNPFTWTGNMKTSVWEIKQTIEARKAAIAGNIKTTNNNDMSADNIQPGFPRIHTSLTLTIRPETLGNIEFNCIFTCHPIHSVV